jgi:hypothetical protein
MKEEKKTIPTGAIKRIFLRVLDWIARGQKNGGLCPT